jgi:uncharacterized YigZ family protein
METDEFLTVKKPAEGFYKEKGSKFYGIVYPVSNEEEVKSRLEEIKAIHHEARHHCYAYRYGIEEEHFRMNDDGEPSSTAGKPIYGQILSHKLTNVLVVVVRYFGGTLLGTRGLIRSYKTAADEAIKNAPIVKKTITLNYILHFDYGLMNEVMKILHEENIVPLKKEFTETCKFTIGIRKNKVEEMLAKFEKLHELEVTKQS